MAGNMQDNFDENGNPIRCSFCGKEQGQVRRLVKGPTNIFICDECVAACSEILEESLASDLWTLPATASCRASSTTTARLHPSPPWTPRPRL